MKTVDEFLAVLLDELKRDGERVFYKESPQAEFYFELARQGKAEITQEDSRRGVRYVVRAK